MELILSVSKWNGMFLFSVCMAELLMKLSPGVSWTLSMSTMSLVDLMALALDQFQEGNCTLRSLDLISYCTVSKFLQVCQSYYDTLF